MYRIFIFCISFLSASFLLGEKMPDSFESKTIDVFKTYSFFENLISTKDEFETTKEYSARVKKQVVDSYLLEGNPDQYFYALVEDVDFKYNADKQQGTFGIIDIEKVEHRRINSEDPGLYCLTLKKTRTDEEKEIEENSFGVQREIATWDEDIAVIVFHCDRNRFLFNEWSKPMDVATAKEAKQNCKVAVRFQISFRNDTEKRVLFHDTDLSHPTINAPRRVYKTYKGLYARSVSLIFYNKETMEIFWNVDLATYKDQFTLDQEAELKAKKKAYKNKELQHAKRVSEFFQDWETPEGNFFGKFVKTQKNIIFFEKEDGSQVQVNYDELSPRYQDLVKVAKIFKKVMNTLTKPRVWDTDSDKKYKAAIINVEIETDFYSGNEFMRLKLKQHNGEIRVLSPKHLSEKDKKWFESTYNEFSKARQNYEEKYSVNLMKE